MCDCDDGSHAITWDSVQRTARKDHKCSDCQAVIPAGSGYNYWHGVAADPPGRSYGWSTKECMACSVMRHFVEEEAPNNCFPFGRLGECVDEAVDTGALDINDIRGHCESGEIPEDVRRILEERYPDWFKDEEEGETVVRDHPNQVFFPFE